MKAYEVGPPGARILYVDGTAEYRELEGWGVELINFMSARLRQALRALSFPPLQPDAVIPKGPDFAYHTAPDVFLGRQGYGPLYVVWDTNLLIDYFQFGSLLWQGADLPDYVEEEYKGELEGLQFLLSLWAMRDIRFVILPQSINDAKKKLSSQRRHERIQAFDEFVAALRLMGWSPDGMEVPSREGLLILPDSLLEDALVAIPAGFDRNLVRAAVPCGVHVFLSRDDRVLKARSKMRLFGLSLASPLDLFEWLLGNGSYYCFLELRYAHWPLPDQQRVGHLIQALPHWDDGGNKVGE